jgi:predicted metalloprotease
MAQRSQADRPPVVGVLVLGALLAGCAGTVPGVGSPGLGVPTDVAAEDAAITGATDGEPDRLARNALTDATTFWEQAAPEFFGEDFTPLRGFFSVDGDDWNASDYPATGVGCADSPQSPGEVAGNAGYFYRCDIIAYDRDLLEELATDYRPFVVAMLMAHEFGHAVQNRFGSRDTLILRETQADCFAGAFTRWVADGGAQHVSLRRPELDDVLRGFLAVRDTVGTTPDHGSLFDRVSAFSEGFDAGVAACRENFGADRVFTAAEFTDEELATGGNAPYADIVDWTVATLAQAWVQDFPAAFGRAFRPPVITPFDGTAPACGDQQTVDRDLVYCAADNTVHVDEADLARPVHGEIGDFAVTAAIALPYSLAVRDQAGGSTDDAAAGRSAACLTGWYTAQWFNRVFEELAVISPGDIDEAVLFLLVHGVAETVFPATEASGFELVGAFRAGLLDGVMACDVGA